MMKRSKTRVAATAIALVLGSLAAYEGVLQISGNFHTVIAGQLYRSAQPTSAQLERYVRDHGIETVINLRGENTADWYRQEIATSEKLGIKHIDFRMSASQELDPERAAELVAVMKSAPKPILIHCQAGADRSGLASALYSHWVAQKSEHFAEGQLSFYYGHVGLPYVSTAWPMDESWEKLEHLSLDKTAVTQDIVGIASEDNTDVLTQTIDTPSS
jgi:protein tyrosine/serine phosphatase